KNQTIRELAEAVVGEGGGGGGERREAEQGIIVGEVELTPIQRWYLEQEQEQGEHYNQSPLFEVGKDVKEEWLEEVWRAVMRQHDQLRARFEKRGGKWRQEVVGEEAVEGIRRMELRGTGERNKELEEACEEVQRSLRLREGPVAVAAMIGMGEGERRLLI